MKNDYMKQQLAKILFIEDSKNEFRLTNALLEKEGLEVDMVFARSTKKATEFLKKNQVDLMILDKQLALLDNFKLIKYIANNKCSSDIPVVLMLGIQYTQKAEFSKYKQDTKLVLRIDKPLNYDKLISVVNQIKNLSFHREKNKIYLYKKTS